MVVVARFVDVVDVDAALALCPPGFRVGVNPSYDLFGQEPIPVEWEMDTEGRPSEDEQRSAIAAVDALLSEAAIPIRASFNGVTVPGD